MHFVGLATSHPVARRLFIALILIGASGLGSSSSAGVVAFLDYNDFDVRLSELASKAGVAAFSASEVNQIQANIQSNLESSFSGYTVTFQSAAPASGNYERIRFGSTSSSSSSLGLADKIDYRNQTKNDVARVYTANFGFIVEKSDPRGQQITELSIALSGTAAHELGHNIGLQHHDSFGSVDFVASNGEGGGPSGGQQNNHIMATGSTGLGEGGREKKRTWSDLSAAKLEFTDDVVDTVLASISEQGKGHTTAADAQKIEFQKFVNGKTRYDEGANIIGSISKTEEDDFYSFDVNAGDLVAFNVLSDGIGGIANRIDSFVELYDVDGATVLADNDDIYYNGSGINNGGTRHSLDSLLLNYEFQQTGTYYLKLRAYNSSTDTGDYELFMARNYSAVPEPGTFGLLAALTLLVGGVRWVRRRKQTVQLRRSA